jgi:hypothetical protein
MNLTAESYIIVSEASRVAQVVKHLSSKHEALSSIPLTHTGVKKNVIACNHLYL